MARKYATKHVTIENELHEKVKQRAQSENKTVRAFVQAVLKDYLEKGTTELWRNEGSREA